MKTSKSIIKKPRATSIQYDEAFDSLAVFLFEQYRKHKEEIGLNRGK